MSSSTSPTGRRSGPWTRASGVPGRRRSSRGSSLDSQVCVCGAALPAAGQVGGTSQGAMVTCCCGRSAQPLFHGHRAVIAEDAPVSVRDLLHGTSLTEPALTKLMGHLQIALRANRFMDGSQSYTLHSRVIADHAQRWIDGRRK